MNVRRFGKFIAVGLAVGVIAGWLITGDQMTIGQTNGSGWQDKTFALAQHPSFSGFLMEGIPFDWPADGPVGGSFMRIWDGGGLGKRALITIICTAGKIEVTFDGKDRILDAQALGGVFAGVVNGVSTTVYAADVVLTHGGYGHPSSNGLYYLTVNIGD